LQAHLFAHAVVDAITIGLLGEVAVAKLKVAAAKRVAAIHAALGTLHRQRADVHALHLELMRRQAGIEQGHGDRIGFFAGGTGQAEDAQRAQLVDLGQARLGQTGQGRKGFGVTEKPGLGHDHRFDQRLLFVVGVLQVLPVLIRRVGRDGLAALAHGAFDDGFAHRGHVQANAFLQEGKEARVVAHRLGSAENSKARTSSVSSSLTPIHCIKPKASSRTGPR